MEWGTDFLKEAEALQSGDLAGVDFAPDVGMQEPVAVIRVTRDSDGALTIDDSLPVFATRAEFEKMVEAEFGERTGHREGYSLRGEGGVTDSFEIIGLGNDFTPGSADNKNAIAVFKVGSEGFVESYGAHPTEAHLLRNLHEGSSHQFLGHASFDLSVDGQGAGSATLKDLGYTVVNIGKV